MNCLFLRRSYPEPTPSTIAVTLSGTGYESTCYVLYNGTKYYTRGNTFTASIGDSITFGVTGSYKTTGWVKINGTTVLTVNDSTDRTYSWIIPSGINSVSVSMQGGASASNRYGQITVTTS